MPYKDKKKQKEYQRNYQKKWREDNKDKWEEIRKKSEEKPERIEYRKRWWNEAPKAKKIKKRFKLNKEEHIKQYNKLWSKRNPDRVIRKYKKYYDSVKGIINRLKKADKKRFGIINNNITYEIIKELDEKYKRCLYCKGEFKPRFDYDHLNPFKQFSKDNIIKVCSKCNQSKNNANLLDWMKFKGYEITEEIMELYNKVYD